MAKQFLYACAVVSMILLVSVSAFDVASFVSGTISPAIKKIELNAPKTAKLHIDSQIDSLGPLDRIIVEDEIIRDIIIHSGYHRRKIIAYYMLNQFDSKAYSASSIKASIKKEMPYIKGAFRMKWKVFVDELGFH
ncbi:uncharacterized protein LOC144425825 [Styela clava]